VVFCPPFQLPCQFEHWLLFWPWNVKSWNFYLLWATTCIVFVIKKC
jgi:hypothetical protein